MEGPAETSYLPQVEINLACATCFMRDGANGHRTSSMSPHSMDDFPSLDGWPEGFGRPAKGLGLLPWLHDGLTAAKELEVCIDPLIEAEVCHPETAKAQSPVPQIQHLECSIASQLANKPAAQRQTDKQTDRKK